MRGRAKLVGLAFGAFLALVSPAWAQLAVLLPNGEQQFVDSNGAPLAAGSAGFYVPSTLTPKTVWADPAQATPLVNPVVLDSAGRAIIYGSGQYREIIKDVNGSTIWDQLTYGQGPFPVWGGTSTGTGNAPVVSAGNWVLQNGAQIAWRVGANNTSGTSLTIGALSYTVYKDGIGGPVALTGGELIAGNLVIATYDSVLGGLHLVSAAPGASAIGKLGSLAAASTTDLGTITSQNVSVTGTGVTISSFGSSASTSSPLYLVGFTGTTNTLTQSASLLLPGNTTTKINSGDSLWALYGGSGVWDVLEIMRSGGPAEPIFGQAKLNFTSTTVVTLAPLNGNQVTFPSGATCTVPNAGIPATITNANINGVAGQTLSINTLYYDYLWNSGTASAPNCVQDFSTTSHATDANSGIEIKSGDATRVLIGMVYPQTGPIFASDATKRLVASWFNRKPQQLANTFTTNRATNSGTFVELNAEIRIQFVSWGDAVWTGYNGGVSGTVGGTSTTGTGGPSLDGSLTVAYTTPAAGTVTNVAVNGDASGTFIPAEGFHYITLIAQAANGTATWQVTTAGQGELSATVMN